jgi:hypothetical protein
MISPSILKTLSEHSGPIIKSDAKQNPNPQLVLATLKK